MENATKSPKNIKATEVAEFILDAGVFLMASGAHSGRVWRNCRRIAEHWGYRMNFNPTFTGILVSVWNDKDRENAVTRYKTAPPNSVHLETLTEISHLSWKIADGEIEYADASRELEAIKHKAHYPFWLIALAVGISCGCLCTLAGGSPVDAALAFCGASVGSVARYFILKKQFNQFLSIIIASAITTLIAGADTIFGLGRAPEMTLATSVLYLIPGVPLINSVIDLLEGYFSASIARSLFAASIISCIAVGMTLSIMLLGINNF
ncbi:protein of unknown function DUF1212 [Paludibacter propionicigenes WB4]|uniref:Threonine/serine exporter-like N-terminal domain-containing protein n=1 Tax=Paludibacter propionicigenes (strain DSM 17365 / JCM 13257 / WB4) TaxID=694427 RepID=E4T455_PALPW|nr:threonine/serine exporter family protein [Paludibacter propionicigenes]ADQ79499.1 protein of unknown function DUF1212 [Paludibacter propionicigenes WB4]